MAAMVKMMRTKTFVDYLCTPLARFRTAKGGNTVIIFAIAMIPMIGLVGAAVDYSRANSVKAAMQSAVDSAALMLSRDVQSLSPEQLNTKAVDYVKALFNRPEVNGLAIKPTYANPSPGSFKLKLDVSGHVPTSFSKILGKTDLTVDVSSEVVWGMRKLELALALDNTGSMASSNKMTELKKAAKNLMQTLQKAAKNDNDIRVAIVPFAQEVNVGTSNVNATWLQWDAWDAANGLSSGSTMSGSICYNGTLLQVSGSSFSKGGSCSGPSSGICYNGTLWNFNGSNFVNGGSCSPTTVRSKWNGCVMDRDQDHDVLDTAATASIKATLFPAKQAENCPTAILPLTSLKTSQGTLVNKIEAMDPTGFTNVTIGLAWAWHALTPNSPLTEGTAPSPDTDKVIILLTDGENTKNRWGSSTTEIDARTKKVCDNVKAAGIKLYTVRVIEGNASLLQQCASQPTMYFNVQNASQLDEVCSTISKNVTNMLGAR
jgi:Putative Flp pilus-assembly TadE/G-like/von Willebrand factor type A domain